MWQYLELQRKYTSASFTYLFCNKKHCQLSNAFAVRNKIGRNSVICVGQIVIQKVGHTRFVGHLHMAGGAIHVHLDVNVRQNYRVKNRTSYITVCTRTTFVSFCNQTIVIRTLMAKVGNSDRSNCVNTIWPGSRLVWLCNPILKKYCIQKTVNSANIQYILPIILHTV